MTSGKTKNKDISELVERFKGKSVKVFLSMGDPPAFYIGIMKDQDDFGMLLECDGRDVFISGSSIISIEEFP